MRLLHSLTSFCSSFPAKTTNSINCNFNNLIMTVHCIVCEKIVRERQQALECGNCLEWQHRTCGTGISQQEYREAVREDKSINWQCKKCEAEEPEESSQRFSSMQGSSHSDTPDEVRIESMVPNDNELSAEANQSFYNSFNGNAVIRHQSSPILDYLDQAVSVPSLPLSPIQGSLTDQTAVSVPSLQPLLPIQESLNVTPACEEPSIEEPPVGNLTTSRLDEIHYEIVEEASQRRKMKLIDKRGYSYNIKEKGKKATYWQCSVRNRTNYCRATVIETEGQFTEGRHGHNHPAEVGALTAAKIVTEVKQKAMADIFRPASAIVDEVLVDGLSRSPCPALPKPTCIARTANRLRQKIRPQDPTDLEFTVHMDSIPEDFLKADIKYKSKRHLILATNHQLELLSKSKSWYIDGTFKVIRQPFSQLLSINCFIKSGECAKQVPLLFVIMSSKKKAHYKKVFKKILKLLPCRPAVERAVLDFEKGLWSAVRLVLPDVKVMGCAFHWTQALWRKIQDLGLANAYRTDDGYHRYLRKFMALPFLPASEIAGAFQRLRLGATTDTLIKFVDYISTNWVHNTTFSPQDWSVYGQAIRTNNDIEGWHHGLNRRASMRVHLPFYMLIELLHREAKLTGIQAKLVSQRLLTRMQRKKYRSVQSKLFKLWGDYASKTLTVSELLKACSFLNGPARMD